MKKTLKKLSFLVFLMTVISVTTAAMIFNGILPNSKAELDSQFQEKFLYYSNLYKQFFRPLLGTCKVYHHAPVNADGGVENANWFAMEFVSPDKKKGWATIASFSTEPAIYSLNSKGLDEQKNYKVIFENTGETRTMKDRELLQNGLHIEIKGQPRSELLLFEQL
jgi:hypothetical protein